MASPPASSRRGSNFVTFDKDFGELAFREGLPVSTGVILLRVQAEDPTTLTQIVVAALESRDDWIGHSQ